MKSVVNKYGGTKKHGVGAKKHGEMVEWAQQV